MNEEKLIEMGKDIATNKETIKDLKEEFRNREPARKTYEKINEFSTTVALMGNKLDNITQKLDEHIEQQRRDFEHVKNTQKSIQESFIASQKELTDTVKEFTDCADEKFADKEQFIFWRWILIVGILLSVAIGIWFKQ